MAYKLITKRFYYTFGTLKKSNKTITLYLQNSNFRNKFFLSSAFIVATFQAKGYLQPLETVKLIDKIFQIYSDFSEIVFVWKKN